ncbi:MAG TPA: DNA topoisomerase IB, partial [Burkholderiaceae bacterium]
TLARVLAALVRLLDTTFVRIGNSAYTRANGSYGLTTLRSGHAGVRGSEVCLSFRGKSGKQQRVRIDDHRVAAVVRRCQNLPGQELFQWIDEAGHLHPIGSADVNAYLCDAAGLRVTAKDFRTWHGSVHALSLAGQDGASVSSVLQGVSSVLGNTPAVCRKAYVHPMVLAIVESASDPQAAGPPEPRAQRRGLRAGERQLLALLARGA